MVFILAWDIAIQNLRADAKKKGYYQASKIYYAWKVFEVVSMVGLSCVLIGYSNHLVLVLASSVLLGLAWQQAGWLAHDFVHHQVFQQRMFNNAVGYFLANVIQGFSVAWWKAKHCTHHSTPNVHHSDPDIDTMPLLAWSEHALELFNDLSEDTMAEFMVSYQFIIYFPLLAFARMAWAYQSFTWNLKSSHKIEFPTLTGVERIGLAIHYTFFGIVAFSSLPVGKACLWFLFAQISCGLFLSMVFSLNHNGRPVFSKEEAENMDFYKLAIITGRNVYPGWWMNWFTGGLNFQIEHHMVPTIPRHHLPKIAPIVEKLCKEHDVPYHTTSFSVGLQEVVERLFNVSKKAHLKLKKSK